MELLAPAGTLEVFETAVKSGADAVYVGAPAVNARALAHNFSLAECAAMTDFAHEHGVKIYFAMNSLLKDSDLAPALKLLAFFQKIGIDALIIQDLGLFYAARRYFPDLALHASTLMGAHNSPGVRQFAEMGFERVVVAREMRLTEIAAAARSTPVELEAFVHGAMCFSYSGLCMFSSFAGGRSGLRGRCVQPCRRRYHWRNDSRKKSGGYLFSMNDLCGLPLVDELRQAGVSSLKIEGRMRNRQYVEQVVGAYRLVLDHPAEPDAMAEAETMLATAMGRKSSQGYFELQAQGDDELISPRHSGNIGLFVGTVANGLRAGRGEIKLKVALAPGDRLRVHQEKSGERLSWTLDNMRAVGREISHAAGGLQVSMPLPPGTRPGDCVYKVDTRDSRAKARRGSIRPAQFQSIVRKIQADPAVDNLCRSLGLTGKAMKMPRLEVKDKARGKRQGGRQAAKVHYQPLPWWLKVDDLMILRKITDLSPDRLVVVLSPVSLRQFKRQGISGPLRRGMVWALPPVIVEEDLPFFTQAVLFLARHDFMDWQIGHISQKLIFQEAAVKLAAQGRPARGKRRRPPSMKIRSFRLYGHYSLNIMNTFALREAAALGIRQPQISLESDMEMCARLGRLAREITAGITVYAYPPLFTARPRPSYFKYDKPFVSPRDEQFVLRLNNNLTQAVPLMPFSILTAGAELKKAGLNYMVVDISGIKAGSRELALLRRQLGIGNHHRQTKLSTFNYRLTLQ